ncbi:hypothetical protein IH980_01125 [Patescibacteria group bacterium]|nr:hypothetical protein [Patescibacteria group bacterium]
MSRLTQLPPEITKYFWGDDLNELNWEEHRDYISKKIMEQGDGKAVKWLLNKVDKKTLQSFLSDVKMSKKSANFWSLYFS